MGCTALAFRLLKPVGKPENCNIPVRGCACRRPRVCALGYTGRPGRRSRRSPARVSASVSTRMRWRERWTPSSDSQAFLRWFDCDVRCWPPRRPSPGWAPVGAARSLLRLRLSPQSGQSSSFGVGRDQHQRRRGNAQRGARAGTADLLRGGGSDGEKESDGSCHQSERRIAGSFARGRIRATHNAPASSKSICH